MLFSSTYNNAIRYKFDTIYRVCQKKVQHEKTIFFLNMKITKFEIAMNIMWSNLLCVSGFFPVNFGASVNKL